MTAATLAAPAQFQLEAKKSRFLAQAAPVLVSKRHLDETAVMDRAGAIAGAVVEQAPASFDEHDGEPGGSAGRPILAAIDGQGLDRVAVRVTRWYGGVNLGVGGLIRAYGGAAAECLRTAPRRALVALVEVELRCAFALAGPVHALLPGLGAEKRDEAFDADGLRLRLRLPASSYALLAERVRDLSRGAARLHLLESPAP